MQTQEVYVFWSCSLNDRMPLFCVFLLLRITLITLVEFSVLCTLCSSWPAVLALQLRLFQSKRSCHCFHRKVENAVKNLYGSAWEPANHGSEGNYDLRLAGLCVGLLQCRKSCRFWSMHTGMTWFFLCMCSTASDGDIVQCISVLGISGNLGYRLCKSDLLLAMDIKGRLVPTPLPWAQILSTRPGYSELHPAWSFNTGMGSPQLLLATIVCA